MANTNCLLRGPARERKHNNEILQCLLFDGRRVAPDERLLCYPIRNVSQVDGYLFRSVTQFVSKCRICPNWGVNRPPILYAYDSELDGRNTRIIKLPSCEA